MKLGKLKLDLKDGLKKEWIITNGIGGFCSTTVIGANTRRYHGLLVASLNPPASRFLVLSKLDESLSIADRNYCLYTNVCKEYVSDGFKRLESFEKDYFPTFNFRVEDIKIEKKITMIYGKNTTVVSYKVENGKQASKMTIAPIINFRDFHSMTPNKEFNLVQNINNNKVCIEANESVQKSIYMYLDEGKYTAYNSDTFKNMYYLKEEQRGFESEENLAVTGKYEIEFAPKEIKELNFVVSLDDDVDKIDIQKAFDNEKARIEKKEENDVKCQKIAAGNRKKRQEGKGAKLEI